MENLPSNQSSFLVLIDNLCNRINVSDSEKQYYVNLQKGAHGEQKLTNLVKELPGEWIILQDILLEWNNTFFQIDTLLISKNTIHIFEVKNYEGDFYIDNDIWYTSSNREIKSPVLQLTRCESLLRQLLQHYGINLQIQSHILFINPEFTLYHATRDLPIVLPSQVNRFLKQIKANTSGKNNRVAKLIHSLQIEKSPYQQLPKYEYNEIKKGIPCSSCHSFSVKILGVNLVCNQCGNKEHRDSAILRNIQQYKLLFPNRKITTNTIFEWCKVIQSKHTISRILNRNFTRVGHGKYSYYVEQQNKLEDINSSEVNR